jgi:hypothetical protein
MYLICFILLRFVYLFILFLISFSLFYNTVVTPDSIMSTDGMIVNNDWESMWKDIVMTWQLPEVTEGNPETHRSRKGVSLPSFESCVSEIKIEAFLFEVTCLVA